MIGYQAKNDRNKDGIIIQRACIRNIFVGQVSSFVGKINAGYIEKGKADLIPRANLSAFDDSLGRICSSLPKSLAIYSLLFRKQHRYLFISICWMLMEKLPGFFLKCYKTPKCIRVRYYYLNEISACIFQSINYIVNIVDSLHGQYFTIAKTS